MLQTRLTIHNVPLTVDEKELKALFRRHVRGSAKIVQV
jgi:hypothetical protein